jgi:hypothetical protein
MEEAARAGDVASDSAPVPAPREEASPIPAAPVSLPMQAPREIQGPRAVVPLKIGDAAMRVVVNGTADEVAAAHDAAHPADTEERPSREVPISLALIEQRCLLKADSCRLFIERRAARGDPERERGLVGRMNEMIDRAKAAPNCFLWVFWRERTQPDDGALRTIAGCYEALGRAAELMRTFDEQGEAVSPEHAQRAFELLAEADSAMRVALEDTWLTSPDVDQDEAHLWLRHETSVRRVFVSRHMRIDDPADPARHAELMERITLLRTEAADAVGRAKETAEAIKRIRYHARQIPEKNEPAHDWGKIASALGRLEELGVPPTDRRIAEALDPVATGPPPPRADLLLSRALQAAASSVRMDDRAAPKPVKDWSNRVMQVRELLRDRRLVVIGGERRPDAIERFEVAFGLRECEWVELSEHGSSESMAAPIRRPDTALVLVLVKFSGHLHVDEAKQYARDAGKPVVLLKAGYNPEQVAEAVLDQVGDRLRRLVAST